MPKIEETLAAYLSPDVASFLKALTLPSKPCHTTSSLFGNAYMEAGQAGLHTMAILQAFQADLLWDLDGGEFVSSEELKELHRATDLSLCATKEIARAIGHSMAAMVVMERHLWLNLSGIKERDRTFFLYVPLSPHGLFGDAVTVFERFQVMYPPLP